MNNFLVIIVIVASFVITDARADIETSVQTFINTKLTSIDQREKFRYANSSGNTKVKLANNNLVTDAYLNFDIQGKSVDGFKYGGLVKLNAITSKSKKEPLSYFSQKPGIAEQVMAYLENSYGRIEVGNYTGVTESMKVNAGTLANATGGINGDSQYYWNTNTVQESSSNGIKVKTKTPFLQTPNLPTNEAVTLKNINTTKLNYYTPDFSGLRFGITFIPSKISGIIRETEGFKNVLETGVYYSKEIKNIGLKLAAVTEFGKNQISDNENLRAYEVGTNIHYQGFTIGASYSDWGKYNAVKTNADQYSKTTYWTAGLGYQDGAISVTLTHLQGEKDTTGFNDKPSYSKLRNTVLGVDYKLATGISPYIEFSSFKMSQPSEENNKGHILMTGFKMSF